jgi:hypothetical protein
MLHRRFFALLLGAASVVFLGCQGKYPPPVDQSQRIQAIADSVYAHYQMRTTMIAAPSGVSVLFGKAGFVAPDSVWEQCYLKRLETGADYLVCLDRLQFLEMDLREEGNTDYFPCNHKTFASFQERFPCCYTFVAGYVNFAPNEIVFEFGESQWMHHERYILTCDEILHISDQGHVMNDIVIEYGGKRLDSMLCDAVYYCCE